MQTVTKLISNKSVMGNDTSYGINIIFLKIC